MGKWFCSGPAMAMISAGLFGASTPLAKLLLGTGIDPWMLAGLLYLGSGVGLAVLHFVLRASGRAHRETRLARRDLPWLALVVLMGGVAGPVLLMIGLSHTPASTAALLLNVEGLATMAIAWLAFKENVDRRLLVGAFAILGGAVILSWQGGATGFGFGAAAIVAACIVWGIDNNLTRKLSFADPVQIAIIKGLAAGSVNFLLALLGGATLLALQLTGAAALIGFLGYGISLVLFVLALRHLGSARTGAYFSTAPFIGAVLGVTILAEPVTPTLLLAAVLMAVGLYLHLTERHAHEHMHDEMEHSHRHIHDQHHQHKHYPSDPPGEPHAHPHRHEPMRHSHPHYPDLHHRHRHG